ncbi:MAG: hypothetical protein KKC80_00075 [Candidatus Margulisbacteria bacterium]|nr:hypothetical protein [Candidatus Margulisiibacteriota bacterium]MBU1617784.1 hypothetical protein [Candidatus Margulisiibacteriota bacterium]
MIRIGNATISTVKKQIYCLIRPNIGALTQKTHAGRLTRNELLHLVVYLADKPRSFTTEARNAIKYDILTQVRDEYDQSMREIAVCGLKLLDGQTLSFPPIKNKPDISFGHPSPIQPPADDSELSGTVVKIEELPNSHRVYYHPEKK